MQLYFYLCLLEIGKSYKVIIHEAHLVVQDAAGKELFKSTQKHADRKFRYYSFKNFLASLHLFGNTVRVLLHKEAVFLYIRYWYLWE